ncbi:MAG: phosphoribosylpyrophosphate synthetase [Ferruginibacter sp.]
MKNMYTYDTMVDGINGLRQRGYKIDFNIAFDKIICSENKHCLNPDDFEIIEMHRFEGNTNPSDEDVLYAVESKDGKLKGIITSAFGMYADGASTEMLKKLSIQH